MLNIIYIDAYYSIYAIYFFEVCYLCKFICQTCLVLFIFLIKLLLPLLANPNGETRGVIPSINSNQVRIMLKNIWVASNQERGGSPTSKVVRFLVSTARNKLKGATIKTSCQTNNLSCSAMKSPITKSRETIESLNY